MYICQLSTDVQNAIKDELTAIGLSTIDIDNAMNSRVSDLVDTIDIDSYGDLVKM